jgi:hypothetical protein
LLLKGVEAVAIHGGKGTALIETVSWITVESLVSGSLNTRSIQTMQLFYENFLNLLVLKGFLR